MTKPVFVLGEMNTNFRLLLIHFKLLDSVDATDEEVAKAEARVKEVVPSFSLSRNGMESTVIEVGEGKYKSALFLLFLAEGRKKFLRSTTDRDLTKVFFTSEIISDAENPELDNHSVVRAILSDGSLTIEVGETVQEKKTKEERDESPSVGKKKKPKKEKEKKKNKKKKKK